MHRRERAVPLARLAVAVAVSLGCHAAVALALSSHAWRAPAVAPRPTLLVRVLGEAGRNGTPGGGTGTPPALPLAAVVVPPPAPARAAPARPRPAPRRGGGVPQSSVHARLALSADAGDPAVAGKTRAASPLDDAGGGGDGPGESGVAPGGGGAGGNGRGGGGADGLRAWCRSCPIPEYPPRARREGWQGTVDVELRVNGDGTVDQANVGRSSGFAVLDAAAVTVARRSRFRLPENGQGLRGQLRYRFVLEEAVAERAL